jgi:hypothetical protein
LDKFLVLAATGVEKMLDDRAKRVEKIPLTGISDEKQNALPNLPLRRRTKPLTTRSTPLSRTPSGTYELTIDAPVHSPSSNSTGGCGRPCATAERHRLRRFEDLASKITEP